MDKCLVTHLNFSYEGNDLPVKDKIRVEMFAEKNSVHSNKQTYIETVGSTLTWGGDEQVVSNAPGTYIIYFQTEKAGFVYIDHKQDVSSIKTKWLHAANVKLEDVNKYCKSLKKLSISNTAQKGNLSELSGLSLESLEIAYSKIKGNIDSLNLSNITNLDISNTLNIQCDIATLARATNLNAVNANSSNLSGNIDGLKSLSQLKSVNVNFTSVTGDLSSLANNPKLEYFTNWTLNNTWSSDALRLSSLPIISGQFRFSTATDTDNFLKNMANCQTGDIKTFYFQNSHRTSASDAAVQKLQKQGYTLSQLITD